MSDSQNNRISASLPCEDIGERLVTYAASVVLGIGASPDDAAIAQHLQTCSACQASLDDLITIAEATYSGQIAAASSYPTPDLSFLPAAAPDEPHSWWIDQVGTLVIAFSRDVLATMQRPARAPALRGTPPLGDDVLYASAVVTDSAPLLAATIAIARLTDALVDVRIEVDVHERDVLDQAGTRIALAWDDARREAVTDAIGFARFEGVPRAVLQRLRIEITPPPST